MAGLLWALGPQSPAQDGSPDFHADAEAELARLVNEERARQGLGKLEVDERIRRIAREHAVEMARHGRLSHQFPGEPGLRQRFARTDVRIDAVAENVALDSDAQGAHHGLMNSPGHRKNILNPEYNAIGVGVVRRGNQLYVVQKFAHRLPEYSGAEAERIIAESFNQARRQAGTPPLRFVFSDRLRSQACAMAKRDRVNTRAIATDPGMRSVVAYTTSDPQRLPNQAKNMLGRPDLDAVLLGACFARSHTYTSGVHWVVMAFYGKR